MMSKMKRKSLLEGRNLNPSQKLSIKMLTLFKLKSNKLERSAKRPLRRKLNDHHAVKRTLKTPWSRGQQPSRKFSHTSSLSNSWMQMTLKRLLILGLLRRLEPLRSRLMIAICSPSKYRGMELPKVVFRLSVLCRENLLKNNLLWKISPQIYNNSKLRQDQLPLKCQWLPVKSQPR